MPTPTRNVRIDDELWFAAQEEAVKRGETVTDVVVRALRRYTKVSPPPKKSETARTVAAIRRREKAAAS